MLRKRTTIKTYPSEEDLLKPVLAFIRVAREHMDAVRGIFKHRDAVTGLDSKDEGLWRLGDPFHHIRVETG